MATAYSRYLPPKSRAIAWKNPGSRLTFIRNLSAIYGAAERSSHRGPDGPYLRANWPSKIGRSLSPRRPCRHGAEAGILSGPTQQES